jgi:subtilase family serine protease
LLIPFLLWLDLRDRAGAAATLQAISDPASASYGRWLSDATFRARYAPGGSDVAAVRGWLRSQGFRVTRTLPSGMYVQASGSVAQVERTFATKVRNYSYLGKKVRANATALSLPASTRRRSAR